MPAASRAAAIGLSGAGRQQAVAARPRIGAICGIPSGVASRAVDPRPLPRQAARGADAMLVESPLLGRARAGFALERAGTLVDGTAWPSRIGKGRSGSAWIASEDEQSRSTSPT